MNTQGSVALVPGATGSIGAAYIPALLLRSATKVYPAAWR